MDQRVRSKVTHVYFGYVYLDTGEVMGHKYVDILELDSLDFWHKKVRKDGSLPPSDCEITEHFRDPLCMNRNTTTFRFVNHPVSNVGSTSVAGFNSVRPARGSSARISENRELALELLAATNPLRSEFSVPVAIKELVDIGTLFKIAASSFAAMVGGSYLNYKFGWEQFLRDLKTLSNITVAIERRIKEFDSLSKHGGLRRKMNLRSKSSDYLNPSSTLQSAWGVSITAKVVGKYNCQTYGTVRWRIREGYDKNLFKLQSFNKAVSLVFDLGQLDSQTVWNLVPFSWLVDYFVDMNTYFGAHETKGILEPYDICIVRKSKSRFSQKVLTKPSSITLSGSGRYGRNLMERDVVTVSSLSLPSIGLLSSNQMLILAALIASFKR